MATKNVYNEKASKHRPDYITSLKNYMLYEKTMLDLGIRDTGRYLHYKQRVEELEQRQTADDSVVVYLDEARVLKPIIDAERKEKAANKRRKK